MHFEEEDFDAYKSEVEQFANFYDEKYGKYLDPLRSAPVFQLSGKEFNMYDAYCVGAQLAMTENLFRHIRRTKAFHELGSASDLGPIPQIALTAIAGSYGVGVNTIVAGQQVLPDERGNVYYRRRTFQTAKGGISVGDVFMDNLTGLQNHAKVADFIGAGVENEGTAVTTTATDYTATLARLPIRKRKFKVTVGALTAQDDGNGNIIGVGFSSGTVNYTSGAIAFSLSVAPSAGDEIRFHYEEDYEKADDIPEISNDLVPKPVDAQVYALKSTIGAIKSFIIQNRFGSSLDDQTTKDLIEGMAAGRSVRSIKKVLEALVDQKAAASMTAFTFAKTNANEGNMGRVAYQKGLKDELRKANYELHNLSGDGFVNRYLVGTNAAPFMESQDGYTPTSQTPQFGPYIMGTLDGNPVIYAPGLVGNDKIIPFFNDPTEPFKAPVAQGNFMPFFLTDLLRHGKNPLQQQRAAAEMTAYDKLVISYVHEVSLT